MRIIQPINFDWYYKEDFNEEYITSTTFQDFKVVHLPHTNKETPYNHFDEKINQFISTYVKEIYIDSLYNEQVIHLRFEGVMTYAKVYCNGIYVGEHLGGYTPFVVDLTKAIHFGTTNAIVVVVDSNELEHIPPFGNVIDYLTYGGIYREVQLEIKSPTHIEHALISTFKNQTVTIDLLCSEYNYDEVQTHLYYKGECIGTHVFKVLDDLTFDVANVNVWNISEPNMYELEISIYTNGKLLDSVRERFAFRTIEFREDGFYLNDQLIRLIGLNRHQSFPYVGYAMPKSAQEKDVEILKNELGVNIVRSSHYPPSIHFLNKCDELGLLVFTEIPGWQHIGDEYWQNLALMNVSEMILRDYNHPSVILWGVRINESKDLDTFYTKTNQLARELDPTRPTGGVRNFKGSHLLEDVYTYNDFVHRSNNQAIESKKKVAKQKVPYLISEHNGHMYPTKRFDHEARVIEHALRHARVINEMYLEENIAGCIGWCMFDYNTHKDFGSGDQICYHGVMDLFRIPKLAAYTYSSQLLDTPVLEWGTKMNIGDWDASEIKYPYVFTNCDWIDLYKNDHFVKRYSSNNKLFKGLKHAPILLDDLIGDEIEQNEKFNKKDALHIKNVLIYVSQHGLNALKIKHQLTIGLIMLKYKLTFDDLTRLYTTYVAQWGNTSKQFKLVGFKNNKEVITKTVGSMYASDLEIKADSKKLTIGSTYDVTRVVVRLKDEFNHTCTYASDVITLTTDGPIEIIGPTNLSLIGGTIGFWVKTTKQTGLAKVMVRSDRFTTKEILFNIGEQHGDN